MIYLIYLITIVIYLIYLITIVIYLYLSDLGVKVPFSTLRVYYGLGVPGVLYLVALVTLRYPQQHTIPYINTTGWLPENLVGLGFL